MTDPSTSEGAPGPSAPSGQPDERTLFEGRPAVIDGLGPLLLVVLTLGLAAVYFWLRSLGTHYRVTTRRVVIERGLLSKRMEQVDAQRINDFVVDRPFGQRLLGTGNLILHTLDKTTPSVEVRGVKTDVRALYEALRAAVETERSRRGVRIIE
jgi:uncharacterized membrane protein YdbT with pleckstrin-like domain